LLNVQGLITFDERPPRPAGLPGVNGAAKTVFVLHTSAVLIITR